MTKSTRHLVGSLVGLFSVIIPAGLEWLVPGAASTSSLLTVAALGGAVAAWIYVPRGERLAAYAVAMASGALAGLGAIGLLRWWIAGHSEVSSLELAVVTTIGATPAAIVGVNLYGRLRR